MPSPFPLITGITGNSLDDGPGIRSVVFFKGCPLTCAWCHNPENRLPEAELSFDPDLCINCGTCIESCSENAISSENPNFVDRAACTLCFECVGACPSGALSRVGRFLPVAEVVEAIIKNKQFFSASGGGATLSGGEPAMFMPFAGDLSAALKAHGIRVLLETCGYFSLDAFMKCLYPHLDKIYFDIKLYDAVQHKHYCGADNRMILDNFRFLNRCTSADGPALLPRVPLIPGITDTSENLHRIAEFLSMEGVSRVQLLPCNPLWPAKERKIGRSTGFAEKMRDSGFMSSEHVKRCESIFSSQNITNLREPA